MGFYLRCRRLQSGAAAQADSGGLLMDKLPRFAKVFAGRRRIVEMDISLRLRNLAEFFNSLLAMAINGRDRKNRQARSPAVKSIAPCVDRLPFGINQYAL